MLEVPVQHRSPLDAVIPMAAMPTSAVSESARKASTRPRPAVLLALGRRGLPQSVEIAGQSFQLAEVLKHDSWAATGLYFRDGQPAICKFNRRQSLFGFPMSWLGRWLACRERSALERLAELPGIPNSLGDVSVAGRRLPYAIAREFIPGHPLAPGELLDGSFFDQLRELLAEIHRHNVAYVDLHKRENILVGDDGDPYLFDFQISFALPAGRGRRGLLGQILSWCQRGDEYHLFKHEIRQRLGPRTLNELDLTRSRPWWIRLHRCFAVPFRKLRRRLLVTIGVRSGSGNAETELVPEVAFRK